MAHGTWTRCMCRRPGGSDDTATSPVGLRVINRLPPAAFDNRSINANLSAARHSWRITQNKGMDYGLLFLWSLNVWDFAFACFALPPMPLTSSSSVWCLIRFGCVWLSLCGTVMYINHVIMAVSYASLTSNTPSTVMQTNPQQDDYRCDTDPYIRPVQRCTICHQVMGGLRVFEGSTPVNRHRRGSICQTVCIVVVVVRYCFLIYTRYSCSVLVLAVTIPNTIPLHTSTSMLRPF